MAGFHDEFSKQSSAYARFRPTYPNALYEFLNFLVPGHDAAWDVGAGNGQCAVELAKSFARVHASDPSAEQISRAVPLPNIHYAVGRAEESGLADASIDLIAAANAAHWFDFARFIPESLRVLKPGGVIALWGYSWHTSGDDALDAAWSELSTGVLKDYWPAPTRSMWDGYETVPFPFTEIAHPPFTMSAEWDFAHLLGYFSTWSAVQRFITANGHDPVEAARERLAAAWGEPERTHTISWPLVMRLGRKQ